MPTRVPIAAITSCRRLIVSAIVCASVAGCSRMNVGDSMPVAQPGSKTLSAITQPIRSLKKRYTASNDRDWTPDMATLPTIQIQGTRARLNRIRNCQYVTENDYTVNHYDREIDLSQIQSVDFLVVPFNEATALAHTMLSFGIDDGTQVVISVEVRKERGETYSPAKGLGKNFELMYVMADERDLVRLRTRHRDADVYVYPTVATPQQAQALFVEMAARMNELTVDPEFYNTITNNCTTNIQRHVNQLSRNRVKFSWRVLLPGFSPHYAYDLGLLDQRVPFEDLKSLSLVSDLSESHYDDPNYSAMIRSRQPMIERLAARQQQRNATLNGRGGQLLSR